MCRSAKVEGVFTDLHALLHWDASGIPLQTLSLENMNFTCDILVLLTDPSRDSNVIPQPVLPWNFTIPKLGNLLVSMVFMYVSLEKPCQLLE